jgi:Ni,Fe-hydrogenase I large subunit
MARLEIITGVLVAANALSNFGSLQSTPKHSISAFADTSDLALPDEQILFPPNLFSDVKSSVGALAKILAREHKDRVGAIEKMKHDYERRLETYQANNSRMERDNLQIESDIQAVSKANNALRRRAAELVKANKILKTQLEDFSSNLSFAQGFVQEGLVESTTNASKLQVLSELAELDEVARAKAHKQSLLGEFSDQSTELSLLSVARNVHERSAADIMETLSTSLSEMVDEENRSQSVLREAFEEKFLTVASKHDNILNEQVLLNKTKTDAEKLHERLSAAVTHLTMIHDQLRVRVRVFRAFAVSLGVPQTSVAASKTVQSQALPEGSGGSIRFRSADQEHRHRAGSKTNSSHDRSLSSLWSRKRL